MAKCDDLKFQVGTGTKSANEHARDRGNELEHAGDNTTAKRKTLAFSSHMEF